MDVLCSPEIVEVKSSRVASVEPHKTQYSASSLLSVIYRDTCLLTHTMRLVGDLTNYSG